MATTFSTAVYALHFNILVWHAFWDISELHIVISHLRFILILSPTQPVTRPMYTQVQNNNIN
jgi:hypothetical protein